LGKFEKPLSVSQIALKNNTLYRITLSLGDVVLLRFSPATMCCVFLEDSIYVNYSWLKPS